MNGIEAILVATIVVLLGSATGIIAGLTPGLHINLVVFVVVGIAGSLHIDPLALAVFIIAMAMAQSYLDSIPAIFLGVPTGGSAVAVYPGHRLLLAGRGPEAFAAAQAGGVVASVFATMLACILFWLQGILPWLTTALQPLLGYVLVGFLAIMVIREIAPRGIGWSFRRACVRTVAVIVLFLLLAQFSELVLSGILMPVDSGMMAAFTGLFGLSLLLLSLKSSDTPQNIPAQAQAEVSIRGLRERCRNGLKGTAGGFLVGLMPGLGVGEVSALLVKEGRVDSGQDCRKSDLSYIATVGAVGTADALVSIVALFLIGKSRSGASIGVEQLLGGVIDSSAARGWIFATLIVAGLIGSGIALIVGQKIANGFGRRFGRVRYRDFTASVAIMLVVYTTASGGIYGLVTMVAATLIGLYVYVLKIRPTTMMAFLILPTASFFLGVRLPGLPLFAVPEASIWPRPEAVVVAGALIVGVAMGAVWYWVTGTAERRSTSGE